MWSIGEPDLIVDGPEITVKANAPDWWGEFDPVKIPLAEDRYVAAIEAVVARSALEPVIA